MQQGDVSLKAHVANICFRCFEGMLQVFRISVAKVNRDVAKVDRDVALQWLCMYVSSVCFPNVSSYVASVFI
jgi:hypothetical protein